VNVVPFPSDKLTDIIKTSDYLGVTRIGHIPGCLLQVDPMRLAQGIDNIIANSYKYAGVADNAADFAIDVSAEIAGQGMLLVLRDYGPGVDRDELPLLCRKYYRGKATENKSGYGLGLYISHTLIERMGGRMECANADPGFLVRIWIKLDG